jgi:hypothetical protein
VNLPAVPDDPMPVITAVPMQLLAYHVAALLGKDVDQPRNLAKSVTVEQGKSLPNLHIGFKHPLSFCLMMRS